MKLEIGKCYTILKEIYFFKLVDKQTSFGKGNKIPIGASILFLGEFGSFHTVFYFNDNFYSPSYNDIIQIDDWVEELGCDEA